MSTYVDYYEKLDNWYESFSCDRELEMDDAKALVKEIQSTESLKKKKLLQEKLLVGTIGQVYKCIKNNGLLALCETGYFEFDDLVSTMAMTWVEDLEDKIKDAGRYSSLFNNEYFLDVANRLGITQVPELLGIKPALYFSALGIYFRERNLYDGEVAEMPSVFVSSFSTSKSRDEYLESVAFIDSAYSRYRIYGDVYSKNTSACGLLGMAFVGIEVFENIKDIPKENSFIDGLVDSIDIKDAVFGSKLSEQHKKALYYKYGFDGAEERTIDDVAECLGVNHEKSRNLTAKALRDLRKEGKVLQLYVK